MAIQTNTLGISQSDVLLREALLAGIDELRQNEWLLDYVWSGLAQDPLLKDKYGDREIERAKTWFRQNEITIAMAENLDDPKLPGITIKLVESSEAEATLGDIHYDPAEAIVPPKPRVIAGPFLPTRYDHQTGRVGLPSSTSTDAIFPGQFVYDGVDVAGYQIVQVGPDYVEIAPKTNLAGHTLSILPANALMVVGLESLEFRETYRLGLAVKDHPSAIHYLYGATMFCLLRGKEQFLERRGLERTTVRAADVALGRDINNPETIYTRFIDVTGYVRNYWPKRLVEPIEGIALYGAGGVRIMANTVSPESIRSLVDVQGWGMDLDALLAGDGISARPPPTFFPPPPPAPPPEPPIPPVPGFPVRWELNEASSTADAIDAENHVPLVFNPAAVAAPSVAGPITGTARRIQSSVPAFSISTAPASFMGGFVGGFTAAFWVKLDQMAPIQTVLSADVQGDGVQGYFGIDVGSGCQVQWTPDGGGSALLSISNHGVDFTQWQHVTVRKRVNAVNQAKADVEFLVGNTRIGQGTYWDIGQTNLDNWYLGLGIQTSSGYGLDSFHLYDEWKDDAWIAARVAAKLS